MRAEVEATSGRAWAQTAGAAERSRTELRTLDRIEDHARASSIFAIVWGTTEANAQLLPETIRALTHSGNYAAGAFLGDEMVGAVVGFLGLGSDLRTYLHSHILGVLPKEQTRNVGFALKQHQRAWCLERNITKVTWTFDPLVRRNAFFNLHKLGADVAAYYASFYGKMSDGINAGDESDRILISWDLLSPRVMSAADDRLAEVDVSSLVGAGAEIVLDADDGRPVLRPSRARTLLCRVPDDIVAVRMSDPDVGLDWRLALREALGGALGDGYSVTSFVRSGYYVLERDGA